jgi:hypothetical protein
MAQDRWRDRDRWRDEERRRWEDDERRRFGQGYGQGRDYGRERSGDEERYREGSGGFGGQDYGQGRDYGRERYGDEERYREGYGGFGGQDYGQGREYGREWYGEEGRSGAGRPYRGFEPTGYPGTGGFGYVPSQYPEEGRGRDYGRSFGPRGEPGFGRGTAGGYGEDWPSREYEESYRRGAGPERGWWDRARDEVYSWMGDEDAERRRRADEARGGHYGRGPKGYIRSDERIREDVNERLTEDWEVDASNIEVTVSNCEVTLDGNVDSRRAKRRAEDCADSISGVRHVQNNLRVQQPTERSSAFGTSTTGTTGAPAAGTGAASAKSNK